MNVIQYLECGVDVAERPHVMFTQCTAKLLLASFGCWQLTALSQYLLRYWLS